MGVLDAGERPEHEDLTQRRITHETSLSRRPGHCGCFRVGSAVPAFAAESPSAGSDNSTAAKQARVKAACAKLPKLIDRAQKTQTRLAADADTKGSIARVQARLEKAKGNGNPVRVARLENRVLKMQDHKDRLPQKLATFRPRKRNVTRLGHSRLLSPIDKKIGSRVSHLTRPHTTGHAGPHPAVHQVVRSRDRIDEDRQDRDCCADNRLAAPVSARGM